MINAVVAQLKELYYTSVWPIDNLYSTGTYMALTMTTSIVGIFFGLLISYIMEHTVSKAGRIRPYVLIGSIIMILSTIPLFWTPFEKGSIGMMIWLFVFNILFTAIGTNMWYKRIDLFGLVTRNQTDRTTIITMSTGITTIILTT